MLESLVKPMNDGFYTSLCTSKLQFFWRRSFGFCFLYFYEYQSLDAKYKSSRPEVKKVFLEISQNSQENTSTRPQACNFIKKETLAQVFFCD